MASTVVKKPMSSNQAGPSSAKAKIINSNLKRKVETSSKQQQQPVDSRNKSVPQKLAKSEEKGKAIASIIARKVVKREKKVYSLPGQKHDPPEEREPLRIFYETLSKQIPTSEMAEFWMMEHGMLSHEKAKKALEKKQRKQKQLKMGTPIKSPPPRAAPAKPDSSNRPKLVSKNGDAKAKRKSNDDDDDEVIRRPKQRKA